MVGVIVELVLALTLVSVLYSSAATKLGIGSVTAPGPGFYPLLLGIGMFVLGSMLLWQRRRWNAGFVLVGLSREERRAWLTVLAYAAGILLYPVGLKHVGYIPSTIALLFYMFLMAGHKRPLSGLLLAVGFTLGTYALFARLLEVVLP